MKLWYTNNSPFTSYTILTLHSDSRSHFSSYVTSHVQYTYIIAMSIERATVLRVNNTREMKACLAISLVPRPPPFFVLWSGGHELDVEGGRFPISSTGQ